MTYERGGGGGLVPSTPLSKLKKKVKLRTREGTSIWTHFLRQVLLMNYIQENNTTPYLRKTGQKVCSPGL